MAAAVTMSIATRALMAGENFLRSRLMIRLLFSGRRIHPIARPAFGERFNPLLDSNTPGKCLQKTHLSSERGTKSGTVGDDLANLVDVLKAWPDLPAALRAGILAMVKAAEGGS